MQAIERLTNDQRNQLTKEVTFFLNTGETSEVWKVKKMDEPYPTHYIYRADDPQCEISLHADWPKNGKLSIGGNFHVGKGPGNTFVDVREWDHAIGGKQELPGINVSMARGAEVIAREIKRRFLPEYIPMYKKAIAKRDADAAYHDAQRAILIKLGNIVSARLPKDDRETDRISFSLNNSYGEIQAYKDSANLKINNINHDLAERILLLVADNG